MADEAKAGATDAGIAKAQPAPAPTVVGGTTLAEKIDAFFTKHFADLNLGHDTRLWNAVSAFKEDVKKLVEKPAS